VPTPRRLHLQIPVLIAHRVLPTRDLLSVDDEALVPRGISSFKLRAMLLGFTSRLAWISLDTEQHLTDELLQRPA
jgi:hypothetical protein